MLSTGVIPMNSVVLFVVGVMVGVRYGAYWSTLWLQFLGKIKWPLNEDFRAVNFIAVIFTVGDTAIIILSAFAAIRGADFYSRDVEDDVDLHRVFESQFNYSMQKF